MRLERWIYTVPLRLRALFRRRQLDHELDEELQDHIEQQIAEQIAKGLTPEQARTVVLRAFGGVERRKEECRDMRHTQVVEQLWRDSRFAGRSLLKSRSFTAVALLSLALGIGANTAIFTLVDQIVLRLLPVKNPRELVQLRVEGGRFGGNEGDGLHTFSHPTYLALRDQNTVFSGLTGQVLQSASLLGEDRNEQVRIGLVAGNFFQVLGVQPRLGRLLTPADDKVRNGHPVVVLQYNLWQNRFAGNRGIVGSTIRLNGSPFTVVGVTAPGFEGTDAVVPTQMWAPVMMRPTITPDWSATWDQLDNERSAWLYLFGRLKPGVTMERAEAAMRVLYRQRQEEELQGPFFQQNPGEREPFLRQTFTLVPAGGGQSFLRSNFEQPLILLQWLVGVVLLIACANVAGLLLARAAARQREVAIRGALGASRGQLTQQFFVESLLLALGGGVAGVLLSIWMTRGLVHFLPYDPGNLSLSTTPDSRILLFSAGITLLTALLFGLVPALRGSRISPGATLKEEAGAVAGGHGHVRLRKLFVAVQVGLSCLLLIGAGLFTQTLQKLQNVELGFDTESVVTFSVRPATVYDDARKLQVLQSLIEGLRTVPGVKAAGANRAQLLTGGRWDNSITIPGVETKEGTWSYFNAVTPGYFEALGIPIRAGRDLAWDDWGSSRRLCLVNEALVDEYFGGASPVGRFMAEGSDSPPDREIIGVFGNARYEDVRGSIPRQVVVAMDSRISQTSAVNVYARVEDDPRPVMAILREQVRRIDPIVALRSDLYAADQQGAAAPAYAHSSARSPPAANM
ncbi:MAG: FtsX-like permease family protein [Luteitalea sp.]|nr:FtsX-like permease family protein [Luteitalea sp.]